MYHKEFKPLLFSMNMIPPNFFKIIDDFVQDLFGTFPELKTNPLLLSIEEKNPDAYQTVFDNVLVTFPPCMMDLLQENETLFTETHFFLPDVDFKILWNETITPTTKATLWKYLKLILFSILGHINAPFPEEKMKEAMDNMKNMFEGKEGIEKELEGMMGGKIGALAKEIAEETIGKEEDFKTMMKDPSSLFSLASTIGDKIEKKIKSGDLKESELIEEAAMMFQKIKGMPGMSQFESMFQGKMNTTGMKNKMDQQLKKAKMKERLQQKLASKTEKEKEPTKDPDPIDKPKKKNKNKKNKHDSLDT
jgi:hypothetical protein